MELKHGKKKALVVRELKDKAVRYLAGDRDLLRSPEGAEPVVFVDEKASFDELLAPFTGRSEDRSGSGDPLRNPGEFEVGDVDDTFQRVDETFRERSFDDGDVVAVQGAQARVRGEEAYVVAVAPPCVAHPLETLQVALEERSLFERERLACKVDAGGYTERGP